MSWAKLRESTQIGGALRPAGTSLAGGGDGSGGSLGVSARVMVKPVPRKRAVNAALAGLAGSVAIASLAAEPGISGVFGAALGLLMLAIAVADARAYIIPNRLTLAAFLLGLAAAAANGFENMPENAAVAALRGIVLALAFLALREIYHRLRHRHGLGLGDVKLAAAAGAWLDWTLIPAAIEIAALTALLVYIVSQSVLRRPVLATAKLPFGLFFAPSIWLCWLIGALFLQG
jgi:leader peptidase (prepilin peptidase)/N-methyltransferase